MIEHIFSSGMLEEKRRGVTERERKKERVGRVPKIETLKNTPINTLYTFSPLTFFSSFLSLSHSSSLFLLFKKKFLLNSSSKWWNTHLKWKESIEKLKWKSKHNISWSDFHQFHFLFLLSFSSPLFLSSYFFLSSFFFHLLTSLIIRSSASFVAKLKSFL